MERSSDETCRGTPGRAATCAARRTGIVLALALVAPAAFAGTAADDSLLPPARSATEVARAAELAALLEVPPQVADIPRLADEVVRRFGDPEGAGLVLAVLTDGCPAATRAALCRALERLPRTSVLACLEEVLVGPLPSPASLRTVFTALASCGRASEVATLWRAADLAEQLEGGFAQFESAFEDALAAIFERDARTARVLRSPDFGAYADRRHAAVRAVGRRGAASALELLALWLGLDPQEDASILSYMGACASRTLPPAAESVLDPVRSRLSSPSAQVRREALLLLGRLEEEESFGERIHLLDDEDAGVRRAAHWSLVRSSGLQLRAESRRWQDWWREEQEWWSTKSTANFLALRSTSTAEACAAIAELVQRRARRHRVAARLVEVVGSGDEVVARRALEAIELLSAAAVAPQLEDIAREGRGPLGAEAARVAADLRAARAPAPAANAPAAFAPPADGGAQRGRGLDRPSFPPLKAPVASDR